MRASIIIVILAVVLIAGTAVALKTYFGGSGTPEFGYGPGYGPGAYGYGGCPVSGGTGSCCSSVSGPGGQAATDLEAIENLAAGYYSKKYNDEDFTVKVLDFGCHQEAYILKNGNPVKRLSINGGNVYEGG